MNRNVRWELYVLSCGLWVSSLRGPVGLRKNSEMISNAHGERNG